MGYNDRRNTLKGGKNMNENTKSNCPGGNCDCANTSIECTVSQCAHHCGTQNYCSLKTIKVVTHESDPTEIACTDCSSFKLK